MSLDWMPDEIAHAGAEHLDEGYVQGYDAKSQVDAEAILAKLVDHGLQTGATLVDLGAGTATVAIAAATLCQRVVAVDVSPSMLEAARAKVATAGVSNVELVEAGFLTYEHQGDPADAVVSRHALHQLPDFFKGLALDRVAGMLRPGGLLYLRDLIYSFDPAEAEARINAWLAAASDDAARGWTAQELATHVREEHSTYTWLFEPLLERVGFSILARVYAPSATFAEYVCRRR